MPTFRKKIRVDSELAIKLIHHHISKLASSTKFFFAVYRVNRIAIKFLFPTFPRLYFPR